MKILRRKLTELSSAQVEEITSFLESNVSTVFHEPDFNRVVSEVFKTQFSYYHVYSNSGHLMAVCPLHSTREGALVRTHSNPAMFDVTYGGWIYKRSEISLKELINLLDPSFMESLTYWSAPQIDADDYISIKNKKEFQTGIIDLSLSMDDILYKCISRKTREAIRNASRKGVIIEQLDSNNLNIFLEQCDYLKTSVGGRGFPRDYFVKLFDNYHKKKKIAAFASRLQSDYLATGVVIGNKYITHLWVAGKPREVVVNVPRQDLLVWEAIKWAKENNCKYFDLCVVESERLPSIAKFKLGFSRTIVPFYLIAKRQFGYRIFSRLRKVVSPE